MGCDIHAFVEKKNGKKWIQVKDNFAHKRYDGTTEYNSEVYDGRNYELFALLANVRNGNEITPISEPKGIPNDASHGYLSEVERYDGDGHSHSYFTLRELRTIPKEILNQTVEDKSIITDRDEKGNITGTCAWTSDKTKTERVGKRKLFRTFGEENNPIKEIIEKMEEESDRNDENIRLVFFFDN